MMALLHCVGSVQALYTMGWKKPEMALATWHGRFDGVFCAGFGNNADRPAAATGGALS
jgi:hypothetical protein